jgi:hypothetical protein
MQVSVAQFEQQNLSNRQQRAMLAAQQRAEFMGQEFDQDSKHVYRMLQRLVTLLIMNFTAEQQVQLENSRAANTMNLNNLSNKQALVMAEAAALAQMDTQNLNNRQQAAVQNAQNFLQMDMLICLINNRQKCLRHNSVHRHCLQTKLLLMLLHSLMLQVKIRLTSSLLILLHKHHSLMLHKQMHRHSLMLVR